MFQQLVNNHILVTGVISWLVAQGLKPFVAYRRSRQWNWGLMFSAGGMPSSHSALVVATMFAIGLHDGFDTPVFALSVALAMIVIYDAAGVRRQAGMHAQRINALINELFAGRPISEKQLKEVLGHTPRQVLAGIGLGILTSLAVWLIAK